VRPAARGGGRVAALAAALLCALAAGEAGAFDCASASGPVERRICATPTLRALDARQDELLARTRARSTPDEIERLKTEQRAFLFRRDACAEEGCLRRLYEARNAALQQRLALRTAAETPLERCAKVAPSRLELDACLDHLLTAVERDLVVAHARAERLAQELAVRRGDGPLEALRQSDAAWTAFRDRECKRQGDLHGDAAATGDAVRSCRIAHAEWRMLDLLGR
jgi:uncharacterized protein